MTRITSQDGLMDGIIKLSEGNPGALTICIELMEDEKNIDKDSAIQGIGSLLSLDSYEIYGADIEMLYKDVCGEDIEKTIAALRACQLGLMPIDILKHAIVHYGEGVDCDNILISVKERLPNFGRERGENK